jgi:hypothetical protein
MMEKIAKTLGHEQAQRCSWVVSDPISDGMITIIFGYVRRPVTPYTRAPSTTRLPWSSGIMASAVVGAEPTALHLHSRQHDVTGHRADRPDQKLKPWTPK